MTNSEEEKVYLRKEVKNHYVIDISERVKLINEKKKGVYIEEISSQNTDIREIRWKKSIIEKKYRRNLLYSALFGMVTATTSTFLFFIVNESSKKEGPISNSLQKWEVFVLTQLTGLSFLGFYNAARNFFKGCSLYNSARLLGRIENQIKKVESLPKKKEEVKFMKNLSKQS
jgi:hypothetical protein